MVAPAVKPYKDWPNDLGFTSHSEQREPVQLTVTGTIPSYAAGVLYRTGPGARDVETSKGVFTTQHWFDGLSMVHRFQIDPPKDGEKTCSVTFNSRYTTDELIEQIRANGDRDGFSFGQRRDPCESYFKKVMASFTPLIRKEKVSAVNVGVTMSVNYPGFDQSKASERHASGIRSLYTKTDSPILQEIDPETLEPIGLAHQTVLHPELNGQLSAAHSRSDPETGDVFNFNLSMGSKAWYRIFRVNAQSGKTDILAKFQAPAAYLHSFFLTQDYVILCIWNSHLGLNGIKVVMERNIIDAINPFDPSIPARWYVVDRRHGKGLVATYETPAFFAFHTVNAWQAPSEEDPSKTDIVAEVCAYPSLDTLQRLYYDGLMSTSPRIPEWLDSKEGRAAVSLRRYRLPAIPSEPSSNPLQGIKEYEVPYEHAPELPTMNPLYVAEPHRYTYGMTARGKSAFMDGLVKYDSKTGTATHWEQHAQSPGEAIFVANPDGSAEDDGILLSVVLDGTKGKSYLLCLDARDMSEMGRAHVDGIITFGFHGVHVPKDGRKVCEV